jgi:hypothetical protein
MSSNELGGTKFDSGKPELALLSPIFLEEVSRVLTYGKHKYAEHNWRKGLIWSRPLGAALRHIFSWMGGEDLDPETGISHLAHAACNLMFLIEFQKTNNGADDRYKIEVKPPLGEG